MPDLLYTSEVTSCTINGASQLVVERVQGLCDALLSCRRMIEASLAYADGTHTFDDVCAMVMQGKLILWVFGNSFALLEFHHFPRQKTLHVFLAGGNPEELAAMQDALMHHAALNDCAACTVSGRPGWARYLKPYGWRQVTVGLRLNVHAKEDGNYVEGRQAKADYQG